MDKQLARFAAVALMVMRHSTHDWSISIEGSQIGASVIVYWETLGYDGKVEDYGKLTALMVRDDVSNPEARLIIVRK